MDKLAKALDKARVHHQDAPSTARLKPAILKPGNFPFAPIKPSLREDMPEPGEAGKPRVGVKPREEVLRAHRISAHHRDGELPGLFRMMRTQILQNLARTEATSLAITSILRGDGKSMISCNLGLSIALGETHTVLLVDLNPRQPKIATSFDKEAPLGLTDHLLDNVPLEQCLIPSGFPGLVLLPSGAPMKNSVEVLTAPHAKRLAEELNHRYPDRIVLYDLPALNDSDEALSFLPLVEAAVLVVRPGSAGASTLELANRQIAERTIFLGSILNQARA